MNINPRPPTSNLRCKAWSNLFPAKHAQKKQHYSLGTIALSFLHPPTAPQLKAERSGLIKAARSTPRQPIHRPVHSVIAFGERGPCFISFSQVQPGVAAYNRTLLLLLWLLGGVNHCHGYPNHPADRGSEADTGERLAPPKFRRPADWCKTPGCGEFFAHRTRLRCLGPSGPRYLDLFKPDGSRGVDQT